MPEFDASAQIEPDVRKEVHGDLVESLFDSFGSFAASLIGGVAAPASAWLMTGEPIYIALTIIMSLLAIYRILVWLGHSRTPLAQRRNDATKWKIYYAIGGISFVSTLGLTVAILFSRDHIDIAFTISFVTMMAGVGALSGRNAGSPNIVLAQLIGLCGPLAFVTAIDADHRHHWLTFILILEVISIKSTTRFLNRNLVTALTNARDAKIQRNRFKAALNSMAQGLCMGDGGSIITVMNHRMTEFFGIVGVTAPISLRVLAWTIGKRCYMSRGESKAFGDQWSAHVALPFASVFSQQLNDRLFDFHCEPAGEGGFVTVIEDVTEKRKAAMEIERMAHFDALTGLSNRLQFQKRLTRDLGRIAERGETLAILVIDLDLFKEVNDTLGHSIGDQLLCKVAKRLRESVRDTDMVARFGGDEFCVLFQPSKTLADADLDMIAKRIISSIRRPYVVDGHAIAIGASIGVAVAPRDAVTPEELLKCGDLAMYRAKSNGRGEAVWFEPKFQDELVRKHRMEADLRRALSAQEFSIHYQPIIDTRRGGANCCEALVRWRHPERGMISPADFIPLAEETGLIIELGEWVLRRACHDAISWPSHVRVAVNLAPRQFQAPNLISMITAALADSELDPARLELEITESTLMQDTSEVSRKIVELRAMGLRLSLDDFGTGYSSLGYLNRFPINKIKIDRSFTIQLVGCPKTLAIVRSIAHLSRDLDIELVAEGVETHEQFALLVKENVFLIQGYLFSRPKPLEELTPLLDPSENSFKYTSIA
jgi:diguanylate cyclase (GGDEF)-like protein